MILHPYILQMKEEIYYIAITDLSVGTALQVWYPPNSYSIENNKLLFPRKLNPLNKNETLKRDLTCVSSFDEISSQLNIKKSKEKNFSGIEDYITHNKKNNRYLSEKNIHNINNNSNCTTQDNVTIESITSRTHCTDKIDIKLSINKDLISEVKGKESNFKVNKIDANNFRCLHEENNKSRNYFTPKTNSLNQDNVNQIPQQTVEDNGKMYVLQSKEDNFIKLSDENNSPNIEEKLNSSCEKLTTSRIRKISVEGKKVTFLHQGSVGKNKLELNQTEIFDKSEKSSLLSKENIENKNKNSSKYFGEDNSISFEILSNHYEDENIAESLVIGVRKKGADKLSHKLLTQTKTYPSNNQIKNGKFLKEKKTLLTDRSLGARNPKLQYKCNYCSQNFR